MIYKIKALLTTDPSITYLDSEGNTKFYHYLEAVNVEFATYGKTKEEAQTRFLYLLKETLKSLDEAELPQTKVLSLNTIQTLNKFDDGVSEVEFDFDTELDYSQS